MDGIIILLAAYNGGRYVEEMIDSILAQDSSNWRLVVSDDGSTDNTPELLQGYADRFPEKVTFYRSGRRFGNPQQHFMHLLERFHPEAPYLMFADQDDVWHPDKVRKTYEKMQEVEKDASVPALVHTDLRVVDQDLREIHPSFLERSVLRGSRLELKHLLVQNVVTGCTVMVNRALAELACARTPEGGILMHDWWLALLAASCGVTGFLDEATIDYRQHGGNSVGAKDVRSISGIWKILGTVDMAESMRRSIFQAAGLLQSCSDVLPVEARELVAVYAGLKTSGCLVRKATYLKYGFLKSGFFRVLGQFFFG